MQIEKQTDPAKTGLVRCLVSKSHGSEVFNCCVQRVFFLSRQDHEIAACRSFAMKKNPLAPRVIYMLLVTIIGMTGITSTQIY